MRHIPEGVRGAMGEFEALFAQVMATADDFGHREHVQLTWLAVQRYGTAAAIPLVSEGIRRTAAYHGAPQKYHATVSRASPCSAAPTGLYRRRLASRSPGVAGPLLGSTLRQRDR